MIGLVTRGLYGLGRLLMGGTALTTVAAVGVGTDVALTGGENTVVPAWNAAQEYIAPVVDEESSNLVFEYLAQPLGMTREDFDKWWETVDPVAFGATFAAVKAADFGLERVGIDLIDTKTAAIIAVGYHLLFNQNLLAEGLKYIQGTGILGLSDFAPAASPDPVIAPPAPVLETPALGQ